MGQYPLISVIIATYNQPNYIFETIDSVLIQDYPNIELIICDDGSSHFDGASIECYINKHKKANISNIIIHHNECNVGTVRNINGGIKLASGDFIKAIAGDDAFYDKNVFRLQAEYLCSHAELLVTGKSQACDEVMQPIPNRQTDNTNRVLSGFYKNDAKTMAKMIRTLKIYPYVTQSFCFKREFFETYGLFDERYFLLEDSPMTTRIIRNEIPVGYCDIFTVKHRASVGISANEVVFSSRKIRYYKDLAMCIRSEMVPYPDIYPRLSTRYSLKTAEFRCAMCEADSKIAKLLLLLKNVDTILIYVFADPREGYLKIKSALKFGVQ